MATLKTIAISSFAFAALSAAALPAHAVDAAAASALAKKGACIACHTANNKMVGPAYSEIAKKYAGDANAPAYLAKKIRTGGSGVWGAVPMPPQASLSDAEIGTLVDWVLAGAPAK